MQMQHLILYAQYSNVFGERQFNLQEVKPDERVVGRVINKTQSPTSVVFALANNQRAVITPTGVSDRYGQALEDLQAFLLNEVDFTLLSILVSVVGLAR